MLIKKYLLKYKSIALIRKIFLDTNSYYMTILLYFRISKLLTELEEGRHDCAYNIAYSLSNKGYSMGDYYQAKILFLFGKDKEAKEKIKKILIDQPYHAEANYLLSDILYYMGERAVAWDRLLELLDFSSRRKTWQYLAKLVNCDEDFEKFHLALLRKFPDFIENPSYDLLLYYTDAAFRCGRHGEVLKIWGKFDINSSSFFKRDNTSLKSNSYTVEMAKEALNSIKKVFDGKRIPFFLISGTLLGCIREKRLLGHDKDIDLGVWDSLTSEELISIIRRSGFFYILPSTTKDLIVIRHLNGISIDIFIHYKTKNDYYHLGVKCAWHNSPFSLIEHEFMDDNYLIPKDYDLYLTENYGDWREPKIEFDSAIDTPNISIVDVGLMKIYFYKKILQATTSSQKKKYIDALTKLVNDE